MNKDFTLQNVVEIPELKCKLYELIHDKTQAQVLHIENDDPENLFSLCFQTLPDTSNGVAHVLEHTVLCGSKKYPINDPFFCMRRRSLHTFMNAMTGSDFTCYPASSQVEKDFYNILEVYLDATFHPNLEELSFIQEGHRLEFATPDDPASPLQFKGIVYNEMKGALSSPASRLIEKVNETLYPDLTYGINSGGDPRVIPELTYEQLLNFHQTYYHPSRCLFYFYGNIPLEKHLDFIAEKVLKDVENALPLPPLPKQKRFLEPKRVATSYPASDGETSWIAFAWLTCGVLEQEELLALQILESVLLETDASPLKKALLKTGLCTQVSSYIESDVSEAPFVIVLQGCKSEDADQLEKVLRETLEEIVKDGINKELIDNAIHQLEFYRSEITGGGSPFGLSLFFRSALLKQHGADPEEGLMIHTIFKTLRERIGSFDQLISKYLLENSHFVRVVMTPDQNLSKKELEEEQKKLQEIRKTLTKADEEKIISQAKALLEKQDEEEDISILPKVSLEDVPKKSRQFLLNEELRGNLKVFHHDCFTNHIVYAQTTFPLPALKEEELPLARLMMLLMPQLGCGGRSYTENLNYIQAHTGGVNVSFTLNTQVNDFENFSPYLYIQGKALHRKADKLFPLIKDMIEGVDFTNEERIKEVLSKHHTALENSLNQNALNYATNLSASGLNTPAKISNLCFGLPYLHMIRELINHFDKEKFQDLHQRLFGLKGAELVLSCDEEMFRSLKKQKFYGLEEIEAKSFTPWKNHFPLTPIESQGRIISSPVAFTSKVFNTVPYLHPDSPAIHIAANLFDNTSLHTLVRERGGAYGGGASCNGISGTFHFYGYRDPNICSTFDAFDSSIQEIIKGNFSEEDLEEAKLEMIQAIDSPVAPGSRGKLAYSWLKRGQTLEVRQAFRDKLLSTTKKQVIEAVQKHILPNTQTSHPVVFADNTLFEKENKKLKIPLKIFSV